MRPSAATPPPPILTCLSMRNSATMRSSSVWPTETAGARSCARTSKSTKPTAGTSASRRPRRTPTPAALRWRCPAIRNSARSASRSAARARKRRYLSRTSWRKSTTSNDAWCSWKTSWPRRGSQMTTSTTRRSKRPLTASSISRSLTRTPPRKATLPGCREATPTMMMTCPTHKRRS